MRPPLSLPIWICKSYSSDYSCCGQISRDNTFFIRLLHSKSDTCGSTSLFFYSRKPSGSNYSNLLPLFRMSTLFCLKGFRIREKIIIISGNTQTRNSPKIWSEWKGCELDFRVTAVNGNVLNYQSAFSHRNSVVWKLTYTVVKLEKLYFHISHFKAHLYSAQVPNKLVIYAAVSGASTKISRSQFLMKETKATFKVSFRLLYG